jgi:pyrrolidone-carboxylate peptidase
MTCRRAAWSPASSPSTATRVNPSWQIAQALHGQALHGTRVQAVQLPCSFDGALPALRAALRRHRPRWCWRWARPRAA